MSNIRIALTNLGKYNEGELTYKWVELPYTDEELTKALEAIGIDGENYEEYFISDYEAPFHIDEYENLEELNYKAMEYDVLDEQEKEVLALYMEEVNNDFDDALQVTICGDYIVHANCDDMEDVAHAYVHNHGIYDLDAMGDLARYIDYDKFGRDLAIEGTFAFNSTGDCYEFIV